LDAFTRALAFFERPGRAGHLLAVATRLQSYTPPPSSEEELDRLRKKVLEEFPDEASMSARFTRRSIRPAYAAGGALALVVVIAGARMPVGGFFAALSSISLPGVGGTSSIATAPPAADPIEQSGTPADVANAATDSPAAHRVAADRRRSVVPLRAASTVGSAGSPQAVATPLAVVNDPVSAGAPQVQPSAAPAAPNRDTTPHVDSGKIYSNDDPAVTPASFVHPQLLSEPQPGANAGHFDLTVDESGKVVRVRLVSPARRYREQLLVSAAKAWRFRPALFEGRPVKYQIRVPINLPEQQ
jgi:hypothetical protein